MNAMQKVESAQVIPVSDSASLMEVISRVASDPNADVGKLERLMTLYERVKAHQGEQAFNEAMNKAQTEMRPVSADASNPQTRSRYASYHALDRAVRPIYTANGFSLSFDTGENAPDGHVRVVCYVSHRDGHTRTYHCDMPADGKGAKGGDVMTKTHATGSAMSYGQRYLLKSIFNISIGDDDDGNAADGGTINAEQAKTIRGLIERFKVNIESFCKTYSIESVPDLPAAKYKEAIERLNMKGLNNAGR